MNSLMRKVWFVSAVLIALWALTPARAQAPAAPAPLVYVAPRFQIVEIHPNGATVWSALLDNQTGCVWGFIVGKDGDNTFQFTPIDADFGRNPEIAKAEMRMCNTARTAVFNAQP